MAYAPDDTGMTWRDKDKKKGENGSATKIPAFMPGQLGSLADSFSTSFGGSKTDWKNNMRGIYDPMKVRPWEVAHSSRGGGNNGGKTDNTGGGPGNPDPGKPDPHTGDPSIDPRRNMMQPMTFPLGFNGGMQSQPMMQQQAQMPGQQPLTPEMLALIRASMMRG